MPTAMNQFVRVLLLGVWLVGSLVMGLEEKPSESVQWETPRHSTTVHSSAAPRLIDLSVRTHEIVVTVGATASSQWRLAVPLPPLVTAWVRQILRSNSETPSKSNAPDIACTRPIHTLPTVPHS